MGLGLELGLWDEWRPDDGPFSRRGYYAICGRGGGGGSKGTPILMHGPHKVTTPKTNVLSCRLVDS